MQAGAIPNVVRSAHLKDGAEVLLRPIRPDDGPAWKEMLARCSPETIFARFHAAFPYDRDEVARHYCSPDDRREVAIVAEAMENGVRCLVGVGRLVADPERQSAEFAALVIDAWQNRGLGGILTDSCCEIAGRWGVRRVLAVTDITNDRMIAVFRSRRFQIREAADGAVEVERDLTVPSVHASG